MNSGSIIDLYQNPQIPAEAVTPVNLIPHSTFVVVFISANSTVNLLKITIAVCRPEVQNPVQPGPDTRFTT